MDCEKVVKCHDFNCQVGSSYIIVEDASGGYAKIKGMQNFLNNKLEEKLKCSTVVSVQIYFFAFTYGYFFFSYSLHSYFLPFFIDSFSKV